jgi:hypothetical protein
MTAEAASKEALTLIAPEALLGLEVEGGTKHNVRVYAD